MDLPLQYAKASTVLSCGELRQQFTLPENIQMSMFCAEFLRNIKTHLAVPNCDAPDVQFTPCGYLFLATENGAEQLEESAKLQRSVNVTFVIIDRSSAAVSIYVCYIGNFLSSKFCV
ncbi:hypothetical protein PR048_005890 [Dryococelus australis]|uniref:Uncharacterized protein n=1 Tax=Dryococelus australis TaxID=614101 RepID=A0ABQ9I9H1_9NEOP|nr:hypothetical protein PR048_005890 [Dryococelus australis]